MSTSKRANNDNLKTVVVNEYNPLKNLLIGLAGILVPAHIFSWIFKVILDDVHNNEFHHAFLDNNGCAN